MDTNWIPLIVIVLALVIIAVVWGYSGSIRANLKIPCVNFNVEGENHPPAATTHQPSAPQPAVVIEDATSSKGGVVAEDGTGRGVRVKGVKVADDILASSRDQNASPKPTGNDPKV